MTGFGAASGELGKGSVTVEARSVNSRHLKLNFRLPDGAETTEARLRSLAATRLSRGHVDFRVIVEGEASEEPFLELDDARVEAYLAAIDRLQQHYDLAGRPDLSLLLKFGNILKVNRHNAFNESNIGRVVEVAGQALDGLVEMREREGKQLEEELRERVVEIYRRVGVIRELAPERLSRERDRLRMAVEELAGGLTLDSDRLAREVAVMAERWDIREELVRSLAHLQSFEEYLSMPAGEPVGKRLAFLVQELHRETNTIGSKANDPAITRQVVEIKNELEHLKEQVENVE